MKYIKDFVGGFTLDEPDLEDYMIVAFMFVMLTAICIVIAFALVLAFVQMLPWSILFAGFTLMVFGAFWYTWKCNKSDSEL
jgi:hypothetical protein